MPFVCGCAVVTWSVVLNFDKVLVCFLAVDVVSSCTVEVTGSVVVGSLPEDVMGDSEVSAVIETDSEPNEIIFYKKGRQCGCVILVPE